jgi:hypothetical protein
MIDKAENVIDNIDIQQDEEKITIPYRKLGKCL